MNSPTSLWTPHPDETQPTSTAAYSADATVHGPGATVRRARVPASVPDRSAGVVATNGKSVIAAESSAQRRAASARQSQPPRKQSPPAGVIAPSHRTPVRASAYRLPEKINVPTRKSQPAQVASGPGHRVVAHPTASSASAWYI